MYAKRIICGFAFATAATLLALKHDVAAGKGKPGGGGGGGEALTNPAFAYADFDDGGLFLTTSDGSSTQRLTNPPRFFQDSMPVWSPDRDGDASNGYQGGIAFWRKDSRTKDSAIYVVQPDGTGERLVYDFQSPAFWPLTWSPDGKSIVFAIDSQVWFIDAATGNVEKHLRSEYGYGASFSKDLLPNVPGYQGYLALGSRGDIVLVETIIDVDGTKSFGASTVLSLPNPQYDPQWSPTGLTGLSIVFTSEEPVDAHNTQGNVGIIDVGFDANGFPKIDGGEWLVENVGPYPLGYTWSPDGLHVAWEQLGSNGSFEIARIHADGSDNGAPTFVTNTRRVDEFTPGWFPGWINDVDTTP